MKSLGKLIIVLLFSVYLYSDVKVTVDKDQVTRGERITMTLRITGEGGEVKLPSMEKVCGYSVEGRMQSSKTIISNGKRMQEISLMYEFMPQHSCVIDAFDVSINDKVERTEPIDITVSKIRISKDEPLMIELESSSPSVYVGEPFEMKVNFKTRRSVDALADHISLPDNKNIWIKTEDKQKPYIKDNYSIERRTYALSAQQSGTLSLGPLRWDVKLRSQSRNAWNTWMAVAKTQTVFSNEVDIEVKPLPKGIYLVGDMQIEASVDKQSIKVGDAVNLSIIVKGRANIEDIKAFDLGLSGVQAFVEEPTLSHYLQDGKYFGSFSQKIAIVAEKSFVLPALTLEYMDVMTDSVKRISTQPIEINVIGAEPKEEELKIVRAPEQSAIQEKSVEADVWTLLEGVLLVLGGFILGLVVMLIPWKGIFKKEHNKGIARGDKAILQILLACKDEDESIKELITQLSENIYEGKSHKIDKKHLKKVLKTIQS